MIRNDYDICVGCGNCSLVCPKKCINIVITSDGEYRPNLSISECIQCGKCEKVCPALTVPDNSVLTERAYYGYSKDHDIRTNSSSGGVFFQIAKEIICEGGVVAGAAFTPEFKLKHIVVDNVEDLALIQGSKYLESYLGDCFVEVERYLNDGKTVLFSGVPCQVAALKLYLKKEYENLISCEVFCHGAPRVGVFNRFIEYLTNKYGKVEYFNFRSKINGWASPSYHIVCANKTIKVSHNNVYHLMFGYHESLRNSCYSCKFRSYERNADISLGDFWGIEKYYPEVNTKDGVSAVLSNTCKGEELLRRCDIELFECESNEIFDTNKWMISNYKKPKYQPLFMENYVKMSTKKFFSYYDFRYKIVYRILNRLKRLDND